ncbi:hypothetical protein, partial [Streptomyces sp. NPDC058964]|uniref:hypothetical protein n=1 Tax=Streptomyces sp. NPDC058964 TaxID=3346681 RepID=UPI003695D7D4
MAHAAGTGTGAGRPFSGPALWYGPDLVGREDWITRLTATHRDELLTALRTARARAATLLGMTRADF